MKRPGVMLLVLAGLAAVGGALHWYRRTAPPPELRIIDPSTQAPLSRVRQGAPLAIVFRTSSPAYVYVLDQMGVQTSAAFIHTDPQPFEAGEFSSELDSLGDPGPHHLVLFASPTPADIRAGLGIDAARQSCSRCATATADLLVDAVAIDGGAVETDVMR